MLRYRSTLDNIFDTLNVLVLLLLTVSFLFPFYVVAVNSITAERFLTAGSLSFWPQEFSLQAYQVLIMTNDRITNAFLVSAASIILGTIQGMIVITLFARCTARRQPPACETWTWAASSFTGMNNATVKPPDGDGASRTPASGPNLCTIR